MRPGYAFFRIPKKIFDKTLLDSNLRDVLDALHGAYVDKGAYKAWYMLNKNTRIRVLTGVGLSDEGDAGEVVGQGTGGATRASQLSIDMGVDRYFKGSIISI